MRSSCPLFYGVYVSPVIAVDMMVSHVCGVCVSGGDFLLSIMQWQVLICPFFLPMGT